jgi:hypothetical protein
MSRHIYQNKPGPTWAIALIGDGSVRSEKGHDRVELEMTERTLPLIFDLRVDDSLRIDGGDGGPHAIAVVPPVRSR